VKVNPSPAASGDKAAIDDKAANDNTTTDSKPAAKEAN
jgi:hypothetical protein